MSVQKYRPNKRGMVSMAKDFELDFRLVLWWFGCATVFDVPCWPGIGGEPMDRAEVRVKGC